MGKGTLSEYKLGRIKAHVQQTYFRGRAAQRFQPAASVVAVRGHDIDGSEEAPVRSLTLLVGPRAYVVAVKAHDQGHSPQIAHEAIFVCDRPEVSVRHVVAPPAVDEGGNAVQGRETLCGIAVLRWIECHGRCPGGAQQGASEDRQCAEQTLRIGY